MTYTLRSALTLSGLLVAAHLCSQNSTLQGRVLYQSSGNKPAAGVRVAEPDANAVYSVDNGDYRLTFQTKRNGAALALDVGKDDGNGHKLELVNEKELKAARLPANADEPLDIIVCPAGQRDIAAQRYYRILRSAADRELERRKKEVDDLLAQKEKDYQRISDLFALIDKMQAALDSAKIREQAFNIAGINLDRTSQMVKDAMKKIDEENDVEGALKILNTEALDTAYEHAGALKKQADAAIKQVIEGYEVRISLLEPQFKYKEMAECYEKIVEIYEKEGYDEKALAEYISEALTNWYHYNDNYQRQLELARKLPAILEKILPADHPDLAASYSHLSAVYDNFGEYQKSIELARKAVAIAEKVLPADHPYKGTYYTNLGMIYYQLGDYQKALELVLKDLVISEKVFPNDHPELAFVYHNLAIIYSSLDNNQKALEYNLKDLEIKKKNFPGDYIGLANVYASLATSYDNIGEHQKALECNLKAMEISEKTLHPDHPYWGQFYQSIALTCNYLNEHQKALEFDLKAVAIYEKTLPPNHPDLAMSYNSLAATYNYLEKHHKALEYNLKSMENMGKNLPAGHPNLAIVYSGLAVNYGNLKEYHKALEYNLKTLENMEKNLPADHPDLVVAYSNLAVTYNKLRDHQKELEYDLKALSVREKSLPADHPDLANSYVSAARTCNKLRDHQKALELNLKALAIREKILPAGHPDLAISYNNVGYTYAQLRQLPQAKIYFEKHQAIDSSGLVYRNWAMYHALQNDKIRAMEYLQKAVDLGYNNLEWITTDRSLAGIRDWAAYKAVVERLQQQNPDAGNVAIPVSENLNAYQVALDSSLTLLAAREKTLPAGHPDLARLYNNIGYNYAKLRQFPEAKIYFEKFQAVSTSGRIFRNWAMYYALQNDKSAAIENLQKAVIFGYNDLKWITTDDSLDSIRGERAYKVLVEQLKKN